MAGGRLVKIRREDPKVLCEFYWNGWHARLRRPRKNVELEVKRDWTDVWQPWTNFIGRDEPHPLTSSDAVLLYAGGARVLAEKLDKHVSGWTEGYHA